MGNKPSSPIPREFSLSQKALKLDTAAQVEEYCSAIKNSKNLQFVRLDGNSFGIEAAKALALAIGQSKRIKSVNLSDCFTGRLKEEVPVAIEAFSRALLGLPHLTSVDFSDNAFGPVGAQAVSSFLSQCSSLEELKISNNGLGPEGGKIIAESLTKLASVGKSLKRIYIGRNRLENGSADAFAKAFEAHSSTLEEVAMYQNGIRPEGIHSLITNGLSKCLKLKLLDLQDNTFTLKGSEALALALPKLINLKQLNIGDCLSGDKGSLKIIQALTSSEAIASNLNQLNLQYNEIDEVSAQAFADKLELFKALEQLFLNGNAFSAKGRVGTIILTKLAAMNKSHIVDPWDDMEVDEDEEPEEEEESEIEAEEKETDEKELDQIAAEVSETKEQETPDSTPEEVQKEESQLVEEIENLKI
jgi:Ran GTPase-activating protein 1